MVKMAESGEKEYFYPRPPRGGRPYGAVRRDPIDGFLSTPSARRATPKQLRQRRPKNISIHALREEGDFCWAANAYKWFISIHALREEGDRKLVFNQ